MWNERPFRNEAFLSKVADDQAKRPSTGHIALGSWNAIEGVLIGVAGTINTHPDHPFWNLEKKGKAS